MKAELDEKLVKKYPLIFKDRFEDMRTTAMCWGFSCGDGWYDLIDSLCSTIQGHIDNSKKYGNSEIPQVVATQVKEKYGTLRFYYYGGDEYVSGAVMLAELMSSRICEVCGKPGRTRPGGWIRTLCDQHAEEMNYTLDYIEEEDYDEDN